MLPLPVRRLAARLVWGESPLLSTIILNWNRRELLETTVNSYLATVTVPHELFIVDNASTDGSQDFIRATCEGNGNRHAILLETNEGGEALNPVIERARGRFIQVSENDIEYLPGWDTELLRKFEAFPELGQISPFSPVPRTDEGEIWVEKPAEPLTRDGVTVMVAEGNVGTSCIIRREVWESGVRWRNIDGEMFRFPDDGNYSRDVKAAGFMVAWNDSYTVVNWGCHIDEFVANLDYYLQNYADKYWMRIEGFAKRLEDHGYQLVQDDRGRYSIVSSGSDHPS
jgi:glycosyltransferase involved in cell wall biosynthesis